MAQHMNPNQTVSNSRINPKQAEITLYVRMPGEMTEYALPRLQIGECLTRFMRPLPRDRELPWADDARKEAQEMTDERQRIAKDIAEMLTAQLLDLFKAKDPVYGYSPQEWAAIMPPLQ